MEDDAALLCPLVALVQSGSQDEKEQGAEALFKLAQDFTPLDPAAQAVTFSRRDSFVTAGALAALVALLKDGSDKAQKDAAGALRHLACGGAKGGTLLSATGRHRPPYTIQGVPISVPIYAVFVSHITPLGKRA
eukprot:jgi/Mesvir1/4662/Mv25664-RA.1